MMRFASVVIDVDSTLSQIEGIEWLSSQRDDAVRAHITKTTEAAMRGDIPLETVYGERLALVQPTRAEVEALGRAYVEAIAPGAQEAIAVLRAAGVHVMILSGGLLEALLPLAAYVGVSADDTKGVPIRFGADGQYLDYDRDSPLARRGGKPLVVAQLGLSTPVLALGDGITDAELKPVVDAFVAFTGVARHERVVQVADAVISHFADLLPLILS
jgi:phosphoserine phosphatase